MKNRLIDGIEVQRGSGNVYADLGLPDAEKLKIKTGLVIQIRKAMRSLGHSCCGMTVGLRKFMPWAEFEAKLNALEMALNVNDVGVIRLMMRELVACPSG